MGFGCVAAIYFIRHLSSKRPSYRPPRTRVVSVAVPVLRAVRTATDRSVRLVLPAGKQIRWRCWKAVFLVVTGYGQLSDQLFCRSNVQDSLNAHDLDCPLVFGVYMSMSYARYRVSALLSSTPPKKEIPPCRLPASTRTSDH